MSQSPTVAQTGESLSMEAYAEQLAYLARCISTGTVDGLRTSVEGPAEFERLTWFVDGNFAKRMDWIERSLEFIAPAFENLDELLRTFVTSVPSAAVGVETDDTRQFLEWLPQATSLTPKQQDYVACQSARLHVEATAQRNRLANLRFQELASLATEFAEELGNEPAAADRLVIHLNPTHVWAQFQTGELLGEPVDEPTDIVFFAVGEAVNTAVLSPDACELVRELNESGPMTLNAWLSVNGSVRRDELVELCGTLAEMGLIVFA